MILVTLFQLLLLALILCPHFIVFAHTIFEIYMIVVNDLEEQGPYKISKAEFLKKTQATLNAK